MEQIECFVSSGKLACLKAAIKPVGIHGSFSWLGWEDGKSFHFLVPSPYEVTHLTQPALEGKSQSRVSPNH